MLKDRVDATVQDLPGAGHFANLEQPVAFNAHLEAFLDDHAMHPRDDPSEVHP